MAGAPRGFGNLGGQQRALIEGFPQLSGWRVVTGGLVIPPRRTAVSQSTTGVPATGTASVILGANLGQAVFTAPAPIQINKNTGLLFEQASLGLHDNTNDLKTVSTAAVNLFLSQATAGDLPINTLIPVILPTLPPTLNVIRGAANNASIIYSLAAPYAVHFDDLNQAIVMSGGTPLSGLVDLFWQIVIDNTAALLNNVQAQSMVAWRLFEGVTTS